MIRRPPRSTLFPTRRSSDLWSSSWPRTGGSTCTTSGGRRSEEHTSELQSLRHLVCRLLLEKKKDKSKITQHNGTAEKRTQGEAGTIERTKRAARHKHANEHQ